MLFRSETFQVKYCGMPPSVAVNKNASDNNQIEDTRSEEIHIDDDTNMI